MAKKTTPAVMETIEQQSMAEFTEKAYLDYSMYVILDRALPHIGDGLKPVQRRIVYAMSELGLMATAKYKKSARTIGDVLGKFHPHGDSACYEAMVLMAQPFSYRYPLVDGQGNWGSSDDPKSFAAMRYTEARLSPFSKVLLDEVDKGTVDWVPNFDGTLDEPRILPARLPVVLLNGASGIAVGMATDILPHNAREVSKACRHLLDNPAMTLDDVMQFIQGPDFPTRAEIITPRSEIKKIYETGNGTLRARAVYQKKDDEIIIHALCHQTSGGKIMEQIAEQMQAKKLPQVVDLRDESCHETPTRLVITLKSNKVDAEELMSHLFATTDLERSYRMNLNVIGINGRPAVKSLVELLNEWLVYRVQMVTKRLEHRLGQVDAKLHILQGLLIAYLNIDEVIRIIREDEEPKKELMRRFALTELQANAILDLRLRQLAKLEEIEIKTQSGQLEKEKLELESLLASDKKLKNLIKKELESDAELYGDDRQSVLVERDAAKVIDLQARLPQEPITVILSEKGWIRAAKGHEVAGDTLSYKAGDAFFMQLQCKSNDQLMFLDSTGRTYSLLANEFPSARGHGEPLTTHLKAPSGATFVSMMLVDPELKLLLCSNRGYGFISKMEELLTKNRSGKACIKLSEGELPLAPLVVSSQPKARLALLSQSGHLLIFDVSECPEMSKGKGQKLLSVGTGDALLSVLCLGPKEALTVDAGKKMLVLSPRDMDAYLNERGKKGTKLPKGTPAVKRLRLG